MIFTKDQVESLNGYQNCGRWHPFTCPCGAGSLTATENGWICDSCDYTQDWAHQFMVDWSWKAHVDAWPRFVDGKLDRSHRNDLG